MYRHIIILALPLLFILPSNSAPLEGRVSTPPVTFKVLVPSSDAPSRRAPPKAPVVPVAPTTKQDLVCSDAQRLRIAQGLKDAYTLAGKASAALTPASVTSNAVTTYLGPIAPDKLAAQAQLRYTNVQSSITSSPKVTYVDTLDISGKDKSVYLLCVTGPVQAKAMGCGSTSPASPAGASDAMTINIGDSEVKDGPPEKFTSITFCPNFFNTQTLAQDTAAYTANKKKGDNAWNTFPRPRSAGVIVLHEAQHCLAMMQSTDADDNADDEPDRDSPLMCSAPKFESKQTNAENWALLGFLASADAQRFVVSSS